MTRARTIRLWTVALWAVCLLAGISVPLGGVHDHAVAGTPPAAVGVVSQTPDAAVLPGRIADDVRAAGQVAPQRILVIAAVLALLVGLPAALRRRSSAGGQDFRPLRARRHTIALRAPPLQFA